MYLSISLESTQMYSRPVQVQDETEQISPVLPSGGGGEGPGGDGEDPGAAGEHPGATGEDLGGNGEDAGAAGEDPDGESAEYFTPVQAEEATEVYSEISDVEERGYCNFSSQGNIEMNFELVCVESEKIKRLYRNTEKVKFSISTYHLVVYIMINSSVYSREDLNVQSELEMGVSSSINKSLLIITCCLLLLCTGLSID